MQGRKPKPVEQQIAEGDPAKRGVHRLDAKIAAQPKAEKGLEDCPKRLKGRARELWTFWSEELEKMGLDCRPDAQMLQGACVMAARAEEADDIVSASGLIIEDPILDSEQQVVGTRIKANPAIAISNKAWELTKGFCSEFGLSPVSRTRLTVEKRDDGEKELMEMLSKPRADKDAVQ
jgi:P27 family predicted phage terminase small subunit